LCRAAGALIFPMETSQVELVLVFVYTRTRTQARAASRWHSFLHFQLLWGFVEALAKRYLWPAEGMRKRLARLELQYGQSRYR